ncbi:protein ABHD14B-like [Pollicipes pollicipes]|uniref:protein ABHD14B-like n=1 Tax=Pollicipes pollicipes TaxID=41117 RepID=UPI0018857314|nr:protein ABHD14B-like [Pollicipes pollicipes]
MKDEATQPLTQPRLGMWGRIKAMMRSRGGRCALGSAASVLLLLASYAALQAIEAEPQAASFFPPRTIVKGNSLYERLVAAGKKSPIIMAGINDDLVVVKQPSREQSSRPRQRPRPGRPQPSSEPRVEPARGASVDLTAGPLPSVNADRLRVDTGVLNVEGIDVFYAASLPDESSADDITFLLLHGSKYSSETWQSIKTLRTLAALGYNAVAIDLPGAGFSNSATRGRLPGGLSQADFLESVRYELGLGEQVILVSPSLSGEFSVPLLMRQPSWLAGYVPVAPVGTEKLSAVKARSIRVPTAIIYGSRDRGLGEASLKALGQIRTSTVGVIPNAGHAAYLDNPQLWHRMLHNFAQNLSKLARQN